jgi:PAS domain S-box-containing protein
MPSVTTPFDLITGSGERPYIGDISFTQSDYYEAYWYSAVHGVAHVDKHGVFIDCNDAYLRILGRSRSEVINHAFQEFTYGPDLSTDVRNVEELISGYANTYGMDKNYVGKDGSLIPVNIQVRRIPYTKEHPFEHFVIHCYKKNDLGNVVTEMKGGTAVTRTTTSLFDLIKDNRKSLPWIIALILTLGFISGNLTEVLEVIEHLFGK